jgi:poly-gamma-glutamate synthesis protein (capsule biosynthesis protein)
MNVANNHCLDFGTRGLEDTRAHLQSAGIGCFGAGPDAAAARAPLIREVAGLRLGFIGACHASTKPGAMAGAGSAGVAPLDAQALLEDIRALVPEVDHVIAVLHWGLEYSHYPTPEQVELAHAAVDAGASAVIGHHSHSIQGIETYKGAVIAYSLANLTDAPVDWQGPSRHYSCDITEVDREGLLLKLEITRDSVALAETVPLWLDDDGAPTRAGGERARKILAALAAYSAKIAEGGLDAYWRETVVGSRVSGPLMSWWADGSLWDKVRRFRPGQLVTAWILLKTWVRLRFSRSESKWELFNSRNDTTPMPSAERRRTEG